VGFGLTDQCRTATVMRKWRHQSSNPRPHTGLTKRRSWSRIHSDF
jgi:hypothetical protein